MDTLKKQYEYFNAISKELAERYNGKFVIVHNESITGAYGSFQEAMKQALENGLEVGTFLIQECSSDPESLMQTFRSRAIFS